MHQVKLRSPIGVFFLALITGGIYYFYWFYRVNEEAAIISRDEEANPGLSLLAATLGILLIVPFFWTHWTTANRVLPVPGIGAPLFYTLWLQGKLNKFGRRERMATPQPSAT